MKDQLSGQELIEQARGLVASADPVAPAIVEQLCKKLEWCLEMTLSSNVPAQEQDADDWSHYATDLGIWGIEEMQGAAKALADAPIPLFQDRALEYSMSALRRLEAEFADVQAQLKQYKKMYKETRATEITLYQQELELAQAYIETLSRYLAKSVRLLAEYVFDDGMHEDRRFDSGVWQSCAERCLHCRSMKLINKPFVAAVYMEQLKKQQQEAKRDKGTGDE
jgi:hypothetical protein